MKKFEKYERRGLPGGPNEVASYMTGAFSTQGYKSNSPDKYNDFNIIASNNITMKGVDFPVFGMDNLGNMAAMMPGADYKFPGDMVFELPMAQRGLETSTDNPLLPFSAEKMRAYKAGEIDLLQLTSDDRHIKDMPYYQDRYDFTDNTQRFYNQEPTIDLSTQTSKYTNLPKEFEVILQKEPELDPDDFMGGPPEKEDYPTFNDYLDAVDIYWDNYDNEFEKMRTDGDNYNTVSFGNPVPFDPTIEYIDKASTTPSQLNEFYDQDLYDQYNYIRRIYSDIGDLNDSGNTGAPGTILSDYLFNIPVAPGTSKDDLGVKSYMLTADKDISINDFLTVNPITKEVTFEEKFFYPEYLNIPYSIDDIISNPRYADEYNLQVTKTTKDGRPYYNIIGTPPSYTETYEDGSKNVRTGIVSPITVQIPRGGSRKLVASVPSLKEYVRNFSTFNNEDIRSKDKDEAEEIVQFALTDYLSPPRHATTPYGYGFYGGARQDRSDYTLSNFGVASNYGAVGQPTFGMRYLPETDQYDVTSTTATLKPELEEEMKTFEGELQKDIERKHKIINDNFLLQYIGMDNLSDQSFRTSGGKEFTELVDNTGKSSQGKTLYYYEDDNGDLLYVAPMTRWGTQNNQAGEDQTFLKNFEQFTTKDGKLKKPKMINERDNPEKFREFASNVREWGFENAGAGTLPTFQGQSNPGGGIIRKDLINPQRDYLATKQRGGEKDPNRKGGMKQRDPNMKYNNTVSPSGKTGYAEIREENLAIPNPNEGKFIYQYQEGGELEQRAIAMGESPEYARAVQTMINEGATIQDLASRRMGTVSGLSTLFPDAEMGTAPQRSSSSSSSSSGGGANSEDNSRYYNRALKFFSEGKTIDDLVNMRYGTREGLTRMFPDAPISSSATYSPSPENKPSPMPQQTPAQVSSGPTEIPAQPAMITPEPIIQRKDVDAGLAADAQMAREQMRSGSLSTQPNITYENYLPETIIYGEKEEPLGYNSISLPSLSGQFNFGSGLSKFLPIPAASTEPYFTVPEGTFRGPITIEETRQRREEQQERGKAILQDKYVSSGVNKYTNIPFDEYPLYLAEGVEGYDQVINEADQDVSQSTNTNSPYADEVTETEINRRLAYDVPRYGEFMSNPNAANRTGNLRQNDANIFFADVAKPNSVIIDIGAGLGNSDPREAGISTYELFKNPKIQQNNVTVIASDIAPEAKKFIGRENNPHGDMEAYSIPINEEDYGDINNFLTPITDILKDKGVSDVEDIYLRATNGIDIIADEDITEKHFEHIGNTLKDKNVTYVYNNMIIYKPKGANQFTKIGNVANTGMDHRNPSWIGKDFDPTRRSHYLLNDDLFGNGYVPARRFGGSIPSYQPGGSVIDFIGRKVAEARAAAENAVTPDAVTPDAVTPDVQQVVDVVDKPRVTINPTDVFDADQLRKGVKYVESKDGVLMMNPESTATGLYGQLFSEFKKIPGLYSGTREEFAKDLDAQERIFSMRINDEIEQIPGLERNAYELTEEYLPQLGDKFNFTLNEVAALSNFLGRDGARQYFGNVLRDGRSLANVFPDKYGPDPEQANKTPEEYLEEFRKIVKEEGGETNGISLDSMGIDALSALMLPKYVDYINGVDESEEARRVYDKLNRKVYAYAKKGGMTAPNYIASNILKLGGSV